MANPMSGIVVCGRIGTNIAGLVFLTKEVKSQLTKSQICKLEQMPSVPQEVEIHVDRNSVVSEIRKEQAYQEFGTGHDGCTQMIVQCVVSNEMVRRVWSRQFEVLSIDQRLAMCVLPNVAYKGKFDLHLDLGDITFVSFTSILPNEDSLIHEAPWNRHIPIVIDVQNYEANEEEYLFGPPQEDPNGHHKYGTAIVIDAYKNIIFSTNYPNDACKLGSIWCVKSATRLE
uniref:p-granule-associated protein DEPS-1 second OB-fold domain-containing protein n=1 Tax=Ditylenchus dipsaci TaxID=166011 RepID=A0A915EDJ7_9BILA